MIAGIGVDLCSIERIKHAMLSEHFRERIFSPEETAYCEGKGAGRYASYAACFAAREAFIKATRSSMGVVMFGRNFELVRNDDGAPEIRLAGELESAYPQEAVKIFVSVSHEGDHACVMVVVENINEVIKNDNKDA